MATTLTPPRPTAVRSHPETAGFPIGDGFDLLMRIQRGETDAPPVADLLNLRLTRATPGTVWFDFTPDPKYANPHHVHGGVLAGIADFAATAAVLGVVPDGASIVTADLNVSYLRGLPLTAEVGHVVASVVHLGRTQANATVSMTGPEGRTVFLASTTCRILPPR